MNENQCAEYEGGYWAWKEQFSWDPEDQRNKTSRIFYVCNETSLSWGALALPVSLVFICNDWALRVISLKFLLVITMLYNGNSIWSEIIRVISDQNCTTFSSITTLLHSFWNRRIYIYWSSSCFVAILKTASLQCLKSRNKKAFTSHFVFETEMMRYRKMVRFKTEMMRFRTWMTRFGTDVI